MTVSFKLKVENKTTKYYGKFNHKLIIRYPNLRYTHYYNNLTQTLVAYQHDVTFYATRNNPYYTLEPLTDEDIQNFKRVFRLKKRLKKLKGVSFRKEKDSLSLYSNDLEVLKSLARGFKNVSFFSAKVSPKGVKYFKRKPPAAFRMYAKPVQLSSPQEKLDLKEYLEDCAAKPSYSFSSFLRGNENYLWLHSTFSIDFNDEQMITILGLKFPEVMGKIYKLRKSK